MKHQKRVLQVFHSLGMGGAETWLLRVVKYWKQQEHSKIQVDFLITSGEKSILDSSFEMLGAEIFYIPLRRGTVYSFVIKFRKLLKNRSYCAVHDHQDFLSGWHLLFGLGLLPPVRIIHVHNPIYQLYENYGISLKRRFQSKFGKTLIKLLATHIGGTSEKLLEEYEINKDNFPKQWVHALYCAFSPLDWIGDHITSKAEICKEEGWPLQTKLILFAGRFDNSLSLTHPQNHKNSVLALLIFEACTREKDVRMVMAGANDYIRTEFQELIVSKGLGDKVHQLGIRQDMPRLMLAASVLLFPSRAEGLGMVAVEAQAAGLPVLASTSVPDECVVIKELVHFMNLAEPVTKWADALINILEVPRKRYTENDQRWQNSGFNIQICCSVLEHLYKGLLPKNREIYHVSIITPQNKSD